MTQAEYLKPGLLIESDDPAIIEFAEKTTAGITDEKEKALALFYAVRDDFIYDPYLPMDDISSFSGKQVLETGRGWCVPKSALMVAVCRAAGIEARPGYADVKNHMATPKMLEKMGTDVFAWHSYSDIKINGKWVKCTPAFNKSMCDKFGLKPLDFDGENDSLFHEYDKAGNKHMEYLKDRGTFPEVPLQQIQETFQEMYNQMGDGIEGDFQAEIDEMHA